MEHYARTLISGGCNTCAHLILKSWHKVPTCTSKSNITYTVDKEFEPSFLPSQEVRAGSHLLLCYPMILQYSRHRHVGLLNQTHHPTSTVILINKSPTEIKLQELHRYNL